MRRLRCISRSPGRAQDVAPEVKLTFIRDFVAATGTNPVLEAGLDAVIPLFVNKDPRNPAPE